MNDYSFLNVSSTNKNSVDVNEIYDTKIEFFESESHHIKINKEIELTKTNEEIKITKKKKSKNNKPKLNCYDV